MHRATAAANSAAAAANNNSSSNATPTTGSGGGASMTPRTRTRASTTLSAPASRGSTTTPGGSTLPQRRKVATASPTPSGPGSATASNTPSESGGVTKAKKSSGYGAGAPPPKRRPPVTAGSTGASSSAAKAPPSPLAGTTAGPDFGDAVAGDDSLEKSGGQAPSPQRARSTSLARDRANSVRSHSSQSQGGPPAPAAPAAAGGGPSLSSSSSFKENLQYQQQQLALERLQAKVPVLIEQTNTRDRFSLVQDEAIARKVIEAQLQQLHTASAYQLAFDLTEQSSLERTCVTAELEEELGTRDGEIAGLLMRSQQFSRDLAEVTTQRNHLQEQLDALTGAMTKSEIQRKEDELSINSLTEALKRLEEKFAVCQDSLYAREGEVDRQKVQIAELKIQYASVSSNSESLSGQVKGADEKVLALLTEVSSMGTRVQELQDTAEEERRLRKDMEVRAVAAEGNIDHMTRIAEDANSAARGSEAQLLVKVNECHTLTRELGEVKEARETQKAMQRKRDLEIQALHSRASEHNAVLTALEDEKDLAVKNCTEATSRVGAAEAKAAKLDEDLIAARGDWAAGMGSQEWYTLATKESSAVMLPLREAWSHHLQIVKRLREQVGASGHHHGHHHSSVRHRRSPHHQHPKDSTPTPSSGKQQQQQQHHLKPGWSTSKASTASNLSSVPGSPRTPSRSPQGAVRSPQSAIGITPSSTAGGGGVPPLKLPVDHSSNSNKTGADGLHLNSSFAGGDFELRSQSDWGGGTIVGDSASAFGVLSDGGGGGSSLGAQNDPVSVHINEIFKHMVAKDFELRRCLVAKHKKKDELREAEKVIAEQNRTRVQNHEEWRSSLVRVISNFSNFAGYGHLLDECFEAKTILAECELHRSLHKAAEVRAEKYHARCSVLERHMQELITGSSTSEGGRKSALDSGKSSSAAKAILARNNEVFRHDKEAIHLSTAESIQHNASPTKSSPSSPTTKSGQSQSVRNFANMETIDEEAINLKVELAATMTAEGELAALKSPTPLAAAEKRSARWSMIKSTVEGTVAHSNPASTVGTGSVVGHGSYSGMRSPIGLAVRGFSPGAEEGEKKPVGLLFNPGDVPVRRGSLANRNGIPPPEGQPPSMAEKQQLAKQRSQQSGAALLLRTMAPHGQYDAMKDKVGEMQSIRTHLLELEHSADHSNSVVFREQMLLEMQHVHDSLKSPRQQDAEDHAYHMAHHHLGGVNHSGSSLPMTPRRTTPSGTPRVLDAATPPEHSVRLSTPRRTTGATSLSESVGLAQPYSAPTLRTTPGGDAAAQDTSPSFALEKNSYQEIGYGDDPESTGEDPHTARAKILIVAHDHLVDMEAKRQERRELLRSATPRHGAVSALAAKGGATRAPRNRGKK